MDVDVAQAKQMVDFLRTKVIRDPNSTIDLDTPLVSSGIMDSFALLDALLELEKITRRRIPAMKVSPNDLDTVRMMFETAERIGKQQR
jgi:acyl carrier protein